MPSAQSIMDRARVAASGWQKLSVRERLKFTKRLRRQLASEVDDWVEAICADIGKPPLDALSGDLFTTLEAFRYYEKHADHILKERKISGLGWLTLGNRYYKTLLPYGVVVVIAPWNYPLQLAMIPVLSALVAGNAVILKPSEYALKTTQMIRALFVKAGFPEDVFILAEGDGVVAAQLIEAGPNKVFFTGSAVTGAKVREQASAKWIPTSLELGGKDAMIVFADANLERSARGAAYGAFLNAGQVCVGVKRLLVERSVSEEFILLLQNRITELEDTDYGRLARDQELQKTLAQIHEALEAGAQLKTKLKVDGRVLSPVLIANVPRHCRLYHEESFGPVVTMQTFETPDEAVMLCNDSPYGLAASIWTSDLALAKSLASRLAVGSCSINQVVLQVANPAAPFGGEKMSGVGRYHGAEGLEAFSRSQTLMVNRGRKKTEMNWFPYREKTFNQLKWMLRLRHSFWTFLFLASLAWSSALPAADTQATLKIKVENFPNNKGTLNYLLFNQEKGFPNDLTKALRAGHLPIPENLKLNFAIEGLPSGEYAISVYQDVNENHKLDKSFIGIPREPVGASNDPKGRRGPPRYADARFQLDSQTPELTIHLVHQ